MDNAFDHFMYKMGRKKTKIIEKRICYECGQEIQSKYSWVLGITYASRAVHHNVKLCTNCVSKRIEKDKVRFFEQLVNFGLKYKNKSLWKEWKPKYIEEFVSVLKENNIPLTVKIPIYYKHNKSDYFNRIPVFLLEKLDKKQLSEEIINYFEGFKKIRNINK